MNIMPFYCRVLFLSRLPGKGQDDVVREDAKELLRQIQRMNVDNDPDRKAGMPSYVSFI